MAREIAKAYDLMKSAEYKTAVQMVNKLVEYVNDWKKSLVNL